MKRHLQTARTVDELAEFMGWTSADVENFVTVASKCEENGDRLFDARYHMFLRATDSVFITLSPEHRLFLTRKPIHYENGLEYSVFEIAVCSFCHAIYLIGKVENNHLVQSSIAAGDEPGSIFLLGGGISDQDEDHSLLSENIDVTDYELCSRCGLLRRPTAIDGCSCEHDKSDYVQVVNVVPRNPTRTLVKCLSCENVNNHGILRMFFTGQEAATSVIGTALFEELPSYSVTRKILFEEDDTGFGFSNETDQVVRTSMAKQFIAFSDNRQAAAFYSSYLDQTYRNILYKRLILEVLKDDIYRKRGKSFNSFIEDLNYQFEKNKIAGRDIDAVRKEAWKAALNELADNRGNTSLYSMGLLGISLDDSGSRPNTSYNLSSGDVAAICNVFAMGMMSDAALAYDANLNAFDKEYFTHNGIEYSYTLSDADIRSYKRSFIPSVARMTNKRLDYLWRVLKKASKEITDDKARILLEKGFWRLFCENGFFKVADGRYRVDVEKIRITSPETWYICSKCKKVTIHNAFNVCPSFKCEGELKIIDIGEVFKDNHYYLNIEQNDISGCLQYFFNTVTHRPNYELVLYDRTPGGAGHVRRLNSEHVLKGVISESLRLMKQCDCGGESQDASCYTCLRGYYNQKHHDILKRRYVIDLIGDMLG